MCVFIKLAVFAFTLGKLALKIFYLPYLFCRAGQRRRVAVLIANYFYRIAQPYPLTGLMFKPVFDIFFVIREKSALYLLEKVTDFRRIIRVYYIAGIAKFFFAHLPDAVPGNAFTQWIQIYPFGIDKVILPENLAKRFKYLLRKFSVCMPVFRVYFFLYAFFAAHTFSAFSERILIDDIL